MNHFHSFINYLNQSEHEPESHDYEVLAYLRPIGTILPRLRFTTYSSEFGEGIRKMSSPKVVKFLYGVSFTYVGLDILCKTTKHLDVSKENMAKIPNNMITYQLADSITWHSLASFALPSLTIHQTVHQSHNLCKYFKASARTTRFLPAIIGIGVIPFIIHPIDHSVDYVYDNFIRKYYPQKIKENLIV